MRQEKQKTKVRKKKKYILFIDVIDDMFISLVLDKQLNYVDEAKTVVERYSNEEKLKRDGHDIFPTNDGDVRISDQKV